MIAAAGLAAAGAFAACCWLAAGRYPVAANPIPRQPRTAKPRYAPRRTLRPVPMLPPLGCYVVSTITWDNRNRELIAGSLGAVFRSEALKTQQFLGVAPEDHLLVLGREVAAGADSAHRMGKLRIVVRIIRRHQNVGVR